METELYKERSISACIKSGYTLLAANIATMIKAAWLPALIYAAMASVANFVIMQQAANANLGTGVLGGVLTLLLPIVCIAIYAYFFAAVVTPLNRQPLKTNIVKSLKITGAKLCLYIVGSIVASLIVAATIWLYGKDFTPKFLFLLTALILLLALLIAAALLPLRYVEMKYMFTENSNLLKNLKGYYLAGLKRWGYLFGLSFFTSFIAVLIAAIIYLPTIILTMAKVLSVRGQAMGDPSGLPSTFNTLFIGSFALSTFFFMLAAVWDAFVFYYAYGAIESYSQKKAEKS